jgi:thiosulfate reductase cytochrome b subunit
MTVTHPWWLRLTHWLNAIAVIIMVMSGWRIYDATDFLGFHIPNQITLGGWLGGAILWHFAAMWLLAINGLIYLLTNIVTRRLFHKFFPLSPREVVSDLSAALCGKLAHDDLSHYNAVQKLAYIFVIVDITLLIASGLVLWKSVQFPVLRDLLYGYEGARRIHFFAMGALVGFFIVHVIMVALVPRTLIGMIRGKA